MPRQATIAASNMYCKARLRAAKYNPDFSTRVGAIEYLSGVSEDSLKKYELGITKAPNDVVAIMADAYNAPELIYEYCAKECPLGRNCREIEETPIERTLIRLMNKEGVIDKVSCTLRDALDDGVLSEDELQSIPELRSELLETKQRIEEMLVALEKAERLGTFGK